MRDGECRTWLEQVEKRLEKVEDCVKSNEIADLKRRFSEVVKELGFSYDENGVFDAMVTQGTLFKLQVQIDAILAALGFEEVWIDGKLQYRQTPTR